LQPGLGARQVDPQPTEKTPIRTSFFAPQRTGC
jgi:hypothetical protein